MRDSDRRHGGAVASRLAGSVDLAFEDPSTTDRAANRRSPAGRPSGFRVVHLIDGLGDGGAERILAETAPRLADRGLHIRVVVLQERGGNPMADVLRAAGVPVDHVRVDRLRSAGQVRALVRHLAGLRPDLIHAHLEFASVLGALAGRLLGIPTAATLHTVEEPTGYSRADLHVRLMNRALGHLADAVVCLTPAAKLIASETALRHAELVVLANGIDLAPWRHAAETRRTVRAAFGIPPAAPLIVTVAVLRRPKGIVHLVRAMGAIRAHVPDARLLVVGDGPERAHLVAEAERLGVDDAIVFAGRRQDVPALMGAGDLFVLPTLTDALPTVIMEAMAAGLPVVASRTGGIPDMLSDGVEGRLVPPGDEQRLGAVCALLLSGAGVRQAMADAGRVRASRDFNLDVQAGRLVDLYRQLVSARRGQP